MAESPPLAWRHFPNCRSSERQSHEGDKINEAGLKDLIRAGSGAQSQEQEQARRSASARQASRAELTTEVEAKVKDRNEPAVSTGSWVL